MATLIVFSGLPATGKSSIARRLAEIIGAVWLRIDSIEQALRDAGFAQRSVDDFGYRIAYALAEDNLRLGRDVVGDSVNDCKLTRDAWRNAGLRAGARVFEIEVICSDPEEHRRRVETRRPEPDGLILPDWAAVVGRDFEAWDRPRLVVDSAVNSVAGSVERILAALAS